MDKKLEESRDFKIYEYVSACASCKYVNRDGSGTCSAFPEGIPHDFMTGKKSHLAHVEGDNGIKYEPLDKNNDYHDYHNRM